MEGEGRGGNREKERERERERERYDIKVRWKRSGKPPCSLCRNKMYHQVD